MTSSSPGDIRAVALEEAIRYMPAAVMIVEAASGRIIYCNPRALEMTERQLGRPMPSELGEDWEIFHPDGRPYRMEEWPLVRSMTSGEEVVEEEYFNVLADGSHLVVGCSSSPIYDDEGRILAGVLIMNDITERKRAEERAGYLAGLLDNTDDAVIALDAAWYVTAWNKAAERMYGWTAEEVVGRHTLEVARLDLSYEERAEARREAAERGRWRGELVASRKDGTPIWVELITVALRDEGGEISGYLGIHRDVSERKRTEEALRESQRRSGEILESISDAVVMWDREWRYTYINEPGLGRLEAWTGRKVTREDVLGKNAWELFPDAVGTEVERKLRDAMEGQDRVDFELYFAPTDEWVEAHAYPSPSGLSVYYRSISERKQAEGERIRSESRQALVAQLGLYALASDDLSSVIDEAVALVARAVGVELVSIVEALPSGEALIMRAGVGWGEGALGVATRVAGQASLVDYTLRAGEPVVSENVREDERFHISKLLADHDPVSAATVVITGREEPFGALGVFSKRRRSFDEDDLHFLQAVANVVSTAVERAGLAERLIEVRDNERRRIARDLHDEALQELTDALALATGAGPGVGDAQPAERLLRLAPALKRAGQQLRGGIHDLRLHEEEDRAFGERLEALVGLHREMSDGTIELELRKGAATGALGRAGTEVLRIIGEALTNARRHAGAAQVWVELWGSHEQLCVEISDDGRGFDTTTAIALTATGLKGMRERAALLGGQIGVQSAPGTGTRVRLDLELKEEQQGPSAPLRVVLVEDHTAVREAMAAMFVHEPAFDVVGQAGSLAQARGMLKDVDVLVVDLDLPDGYGGDLISDLGRMNPRAHSLLLSASLDRAEVARAIESGAGATLDKTVHLDEVVDAVRRLGAGEALIPPDEVLELLRVAGDQREREHNDRAAIESLTAREREVLQALAEGLDSQAIADRLYITISTERNHVARVLSKLGVHSRLQALVFALRYELVEL